jgi:hypothetical protein
VIGKGLRLLDYVERARKLDFDDLRRNRIAGEMGITVRTGSSQAARDKKNTARAYKRAQSISKPLKSRGVKRALSPAHSASTTKHLRKAPAASQPKNPSSSTDDVAQMEPHLLLNDELPILSRTDDELRGISTLPRGAIIALNLTNVELRAVVSFQQDAARDHLLNLLK